MKSLALLLLLAATPAAAQRVVINEVLASNEATLADPDTRAFGDWIELYNASSATVDLGGSFLTDLFSKPAKWRIPNGTTLAPGAFLVVWADDGNTAGAALHANFKLSGSGEAVGLFSATGAVIDTLSFGAQTTDVSYGRRPDGGAERAFFAAPTPGAPNRTTPAGGVVAPPVFSMASGFYNASASVEMAAEAGVTVRYTLDGSLPTEASARYTGPLALGATRVFRAAAFAPGRIPSAVVSRAYFVGERSVLPIVSLVTDPAGFFSDTTGIYVKGTRGIPGRCRTDPVNWNQDWEREALVSFFEPDGAGGHRLALEQGAGVQIYGGCSRIYPEKSLSLHARSQYGASDFAHRFFDDVDLDRFDDLVLRSSAQDWWRTMFRDGMIQTLTRHMDLDGQAYRPTAVFLNGAYWGIHNLREKLNEDYVAGHYGIKDDDVEIIENTRRGTSAAYDEVLDLLDAGDLSTPAALAAVEAKVDVDAYLNYLIAEIYSANSDWPGHNLKLWRARTPGSRWRWMLYDTDFGFGGNANGQVTSNTLAHAGAAASTGEYNPPWSTLLFRKLLTNTRVRNTFIQRLAAHAGTTFDPQRTLGLIDSLKANIAPEMPRHKVRWPQSASFAPTWDALVDEMRTFATGRPMAVRGHVAGFFPEVPGSARLTLTTTPGGRVFAAGVLMAPLRLDGTPQPAAGVFAPIFYRGVPLDLVAVPDRGYVFTGWSGLSSARTESISVVLTESAALTATFAVATAAEPVAALGSLGAARGLPQPGHAHGDRRGGAWGRRRSLGARRRPARPRGARARERPCRGRHAPPSGRYRRAPERRLHGPHDHQGVPRDAPPRRLAVGAARAGFLRFIPDDSANRPPRSRPAAARTMSSIVMMRRGEPVSQASSGSQTGEMR